MIDSKLYPAIYKRKSFHHLRNIDNETITSKEIDEIKKKIIIIVLTIILLSIGVVTYTIFSIKSPYDSDYESKYMYEINKFFGDDYTISKYRDIGHQHVAGDSINCYGWDINYLDEDGYEQATPTMNLRVEMCVTRDLTSKSKDFKPYKMSNTEVDKCFGNYVNFTKKIDDRMFTYSLIYLKIDKVNEDTLNKILELFPHLDAIIETDYRGIVYYVNGEEFSQQATKQFFEEIGLTRESQY